MPLINYFNRPEYWLRPQQLFRRLRHPPHQAWKGIERVMLPWGVTIPVTADPREAIERSLWIMGIYDLSLSEALWRAIAPGDITVDIGANIGYMTSLMAAKTGISGKVICFEPNPEVCPELEANIQSWYHEKDWSQIELHSLALSNRIGEGVLRIPLQNRGEAALVAATDAINPSLRRHTVSLTTLDRFWQDRNDSIAVLKIDVEGHELAVFQGAKQLLSQRRIRDIFFEDHCYYPSPATNFLEEQGYTIFRLWKGFWRPVLHPPTYNAVHRWEPPNYLATLNPRRALQCLASRGWQIFSAAQ
jgi:FkbM family methyltransferase